MKNKYIIICLLIVGLFIHESCGPPMYGIAKLGSENIYMAKPYHLDSFTNQSAIYLSGRANTSIGRGAYLENDNLMYAEFSIHRSHTFRFTQLAYGLFGYIGEYNVDSIGPYKDAYDFFGGGLSVQGNFFKPFKNGEWRFLGLRFTGLHEPGTYATFRQIADEQFLVTNIHPNNTAYNISFTSELIIKPGKVNFGYYYAMGITFGNNDQEILTYSGTFNMGINQYTFFVQLNNTQRTWSNGFGSGSGSIRTFSFGLNYRLGNLNG